MILGINWFRLWLRVYINLGFELQNKEKHSTNTDLKSVTCYNFKDVKTIQQISKTLTFKNSPLSYWRQYEPSTAKLWGKVR